MSLDSILQYSLKHFSEKCSDRLQGVSQYFGTFDSNVDFLVIVLLMVSFYNFDWWDYARKFAW